MKKKMSVLVIILFGLMVASCMAKSDNYKTIQLNKLEDIQDIKDKNSVPRAVYDMKSLKLGDLTIPKKKKAFIEIMVPTAMIVREEIELERSKIKKMIDGNSKKDEEYLSSMYKKYRVEDKNINTLYKKMKPVPISILLAQASIESAWGTSRFFREGNNIFGVWSFREDEPRISTSAMRGSTHIFLRKYGSLKEAIADYMLNLARHKAYKEFRKKLETTSNYKLLAPKLDKYSEEGHVYTNKIIKSIEYNKFYEYDHYEFAK